MSKNQETTFPQEEESINSLNPSINSPEKEAYTPDYSLTISKDDELPESTIHPSFTTYEEEDEENLQSNYKTMMIISHLFFIIKAFVCTMWSITPKHCFKHFCFGENLTKGDYELAHLGTFGTLVYGGSFLVMAVLKKYKLFDNVIFNSLFYIAEFLLSFRLYFVLIFQKYAYDAKERYFFKEIRASGFGFYFIVHMIVISFISIF